MYRHLFLVVIEAQNKSCNLGYTTVHAVFVHLYCINPQPCPQGRGGGGGGNELEGRNLESELYVFSQATKNLLDSSKKKWKVIYDVC